jgi:hypothetical protein
MSTSDHPPISSVRSSTSQPNITVLMPVRDAEDFLTDALASILGQTYSHFRLLIVDDGSTDSTNEIIKSATDPRIKKIRFPKSKGIVHALNVGLDLADTEFIARMDADDVAAPDRFSQQLTLFTQNPQVGVCGSSIEMFSGHSRCVVRYPETHEEILGNLAMFKRSICHPSVMMRRSVLEGMRYCDRYTHAEDLHLWHRLIKKTQFYNIREPLLAYRLHSTQVSARYRSAQAEGTRKLLMETLPKYFPTVENSVHENLLQLVVPSRDSRAEKAVNLRELHAQYVASNDKHPIISSTLFEQVILSKFFEETCKRYLGFRNMVFVWINTLKHKPGLFLEVLQRLRFQWSTVSSERSK